MPQHKSCVKRIKQDVKRGQRNRAAVGAFRTSVRKYRELPVSERPGAFSELQSVLDRAVKKGIISRNRAARLKSRLRPAAA